MTEDEKMMEIIQEQMNQRVKEMNATPRLEMDNLSPNDMYMILYHTFEDESPVGIRKAIPSAVFDKVPFMQLTKAYLSKIDEAGEFKLTKKGNLPRKLCIDLYDMGFIKEHRFEAEWGYKLSKEADSLALTNLKHINVIAGITKKRNNKMSLTTKGKKLIEEDKLIELFKEIFTTNIQKFNLGYHDGYSQETDIQKVFGYTLYLLLRYGKEMRNINFYAEKNIMAFPHIVENFMSDWRSPEDIFTSCYWIRIFVRFLAYYGLIEYKETPIKGSYEDDKTLKTTPLFHQVFGLKTQNFKFKTSKHQA